MKIKSWEIWLLLGWVLVIGISIRLAYASAIKNGDVDITQGWMQSAVQLGLAPSYDSQVSGGIPPTYPPLSLMMFYATGIAYKTFVSAEYNIEQPMHMIYAKLPGFAADIGIVLLLFFLFHSWKRPLHGLIAAGIFAFHPAVLYDTVAWGQTDSVYTFAVLLSLFLYCRKMPAFGFVAMVAACLLKPQSIAFLPLALALMPMKPKPLIGAIIGSSAIVALSFLPFMLHGNLMSAIRVYEVFDLLGETRVSWNAYNLWWVFLGPQALNIPGGTAMMFGVSYRTIGLVLFASTLLYTFWKLRGKLQGDLSRIDNGMAVILAASVSAAAFFILNAEMHERYFYPFLALALPLAFIRIRLAALYLCTTVAILFNMLGVFPFGPVDHFFYARVPNFSFILAVIQTLAFYFLLTFVSRFDKEILPFLRRDLAKLKQ